MADNFFLGEDNDFYGISTESLINKVGKISLEDKDYKFKYSNFGISVIGSILAEVYGDGYKTVMNNFITSELKLEDTRISDGRGNLCGYWNWNQDDTYIKISKTAIDYFRKKTKW